MKHFSLVLLTIAFFVGGINTLNAQCTPSTMYTEVGIYPSDSLPPAEVGKPYSTQIDLVLPRDTTISFPPLINNLTISFCDFILDTIENLPAGLTYECDVPGCAWTVDHNIGVISRGCVTISGTPTDTLEGDTLDAIIRITPGYVDSTDFTCDVDSLKNQLDLLGLWPVVQAFLAQPFNIHWTIDQGNVGIDDLFNKEALSLQLFPNPTDGNSSLRFELPEATQSEIAIYDMMGRQVNQIQSGELYRGHHEFELNMDGLTDGIYLVRLSLDGGQSVITEKLNLQR